tara:strand:- start:8529 stop:8687 length:159 start_codon:yes stop_codon:yes gene_type:complete
MSDLHKWDPEDQDFWEKGGKKNSESQFVDFDSQFASWFCYLALLGHYYRPNA